MSRSMVQSAPVDWSSWVAWPWKWLVPIGGNLTVTNTEKVNIDSINRLSRNSRAAAAGCRAAAWHPSNRHPGPPGPGVPPGHRLQAAQGGCCAPPARALCLLSLLSACQLAAAWHNITLQNLQHHRHPACCALSARAEGNLTLSIPLAGARAAPGGWCGAQAARCCTSAGTAGCKRSGQAHMLTPQYSHLRRPGRSCGCVWWAARGTASTTRPSSTSCWRLPTRCAAGPGCRPPPSSCRSPCTEIPPCAGASCGLEAPTWMGEEFGNTIVWYRKAVRKYFCSGPSWRCRFQHSL